MSSEQKKPDIVLEVDGQKYGGWKSIDITRGLEQCAGTFRLSVTDRWPQQDKPRAIAAGAPCRVTIDGTPVVTGYVDDVEASWSATSHDYRISGRDKTMDLIDCCPPSLQLKGADLPALAKRWAQLFGIEVKVEAECITSCIECGSCQYTCPSHRPILDNIRFGKSKVMGIIRARNAKK